MCIVYAFDLRRFGASHIAFVFFRFLFYLFEFESHSKCAPISLAHSPSTPCKCYPFQFKCVSCVLCVCVFAAKWLHNKCRTQKREYFFGGFNIWSYERIRARSAHNVVAEGDQFRCRKWTCWTIWSKACKIGNFRRFDMERNCSTFDMHSRLSLMWCEYWIHNWNSSYYCFCKQQDWLLTFTNQT